MAPSDVHVQAAGALEGEMAQAPGGPCVGYRRAASNGADREAGLKTADPVSPDRQGGLPRAGGVLRTVAQNRRQRGCRKATRLGRATAPSWLPSRHPRTRDRKRVV